MTYGRVSCVALPALMTPTVTTARAQTDCVFSNRPSEAKFKNGKNVAKYVWDKDRLAARLVTKNRELVSVQY